MAQHLVASVVLRYYRQELDVGRVLFDYGKLFLLRSAFQYYLLLHVVALHRFDYLSGIVAELVDVDVAASFEMFKNFVKCRQSNLGRCAVVVAKSELSHFIRRHLLDMHVHAEVSLLHSGVEDEKLAVCAFCHVYLDHIRAFTNGNVVRCQVVAGDISAAYTAVSTEDNSFRRCFSDVKSHFLPFLKTDFISFIVIILNNTTSNA